MGKCKCKEALRALCANIRPGSAAPAELPGTSAPPRPGSELIHSAVTSGAGGSAGAGGAARGRAPGAPRGRGRAPPNEAKDRSAEARQVGREQGCGHAGAVRDSQDRVLSPVWPESALPSAEAEG